MTNPFSKGDRSAGDHRHGEADGGGFQTGADATRAAAANGEAVRGYVDVPADGAPLRHRTRGCRYRRGCRG